MLFLLSIAFIQARANVNLEKICNYYENVDAILQSKAKNAVNYTDVLTIPKNSCVDKSLVTTDMFFQVKVTIDIYEELSGDLELKNRTCASEAVAFIVPDKETYLPTMDVAMDPDKCEGTDIIISNYCKNTTNVKITGTLPGEGTKEETMPYFESLAITDLTPSSDVYPFTFSGDGMTDIEQKIQGNELCEAVANIYLVLYGKNGNCEARQVKYVPAESEGKCSSGGGDDSSSAALFTFLVVALAMLQL